MVGKGGKARDGRGEGGKSERTRVKRRELQSENGWTIITHGLSNMSLNKQDAGSFPTQVVDGLTVEKLKEDFGKLQERWEEAALARQIEEIFRKRRWDVRQALCIGVGSFSRDWAHRWRSLWQLVLFVGVVEQCKLGCFTRMVASALPRVSFPAAYCSSHYTVL
jgi:hypothetical protein